MQEPIWYEALMSLASSPFGAVALVAVPGMGAAGPALVPIGLLGALFFGL